MDTAGGAHGIKILWPRRLRILGAYQHQANDLVGGFVGGRDGALPRLLVEHQGYTLGRKERPVGHWQNMHYSRQDIRRPRQPVNGVRLWRQHACSIVTHVKDFLFYWFRVPNKMIRPCC